MRADNRIALAAVVALLEASALEELRVVAPLLRGILESEEAPSAGRDVKPATLRQQRWRERELEKRRAERLRETPSRPSVDVTGVDDVDAAVDGSASTRGGGGGGSRSVVALSPSLPLNSLDRGGLSEASASALRVDAGRRSDPFGDDWLGNVWTAAVKTSFAGAAISRPSRSELGKLVAAIDAHSGTTALQERDAWLQAAVNRWAASAPRKRTLYGFIDWLDDGERTRNGYGREVAPERPYTTMSEPAPLSKTKAEQDADIDREIEAARREGRLATKPEGAR